MNLFTFYRDAVLAYLGKPTLSQSDVVILTTEANKIKSAYWKHEPIDYSAEAARLAYMLYYAPKHAIMWREYLVKGLYKMAEPIRINSIGTACGSEIIGFMEGLGDARPARSQWRCLDTESSWEPLLSVTRSLYQERRGCLLDCHNVTTLDDLWSQGFTIGSLVLSEIVKQNGNREFRGNVKTAIGPAVGWFLDIAKCKQADGSEPYLSSFYPGIGYESFKNKGWDLKSIINFELSTCSPRWCLTLLHSEPSMHMFLVKFT